VDDVCFRRQRCSVLCREDAPRPYPPDAKVLLSARVAGLLLPQTSELDLLANTGVAYRTESGETVTTESSLVKAVFALLAAEAPRRLHALARFELTLGRALTTPLHTSLQLDPASHVIAALLWKPRSRDELVEAVLERVANGELQLTKHDVPVKARVHALPLASEAVTNTFNALNRFGLFER